MKPYSLCVVQDLPEKLVEDLTSRSAYFDQLLNACNRGLRGAFIFRVVETGHFFRFAHGCSIRLVHHVFILWFEPADRRL